MASAPAGSFAPVAQFPGGFSVVKRGPMFHSIVREIRITHREAADRPLARGAGHRREAGAAEHLDQDAAVIAVALALCLSAGPASARLRVVTTTSDLADPYHTFLVQADHPWTVGLIVTDPDGASIASAGVDGTVRIWSPSDGEEVRVLRGHSNEAWDVAFSPDGTQIAHRAMTTPDQPDYAVFHLAVSPAGGGPRDVLTEALDRMVYGFDFETTGDGIVAATILKMKPPAPPWWASAIFCA